jgi:hypothetical protein
VKLSMKALIDRNSAEQPQQQPQAQ